MSVEPRTDTGPVLETLGTSVVSQGAVGDGDDLFGRLRSGGPEHDGAIQELRLLMLRAARHQLSTMRGDGRGFDGRRLDDLASAAADEATVAALSRLDSFEGRSRFTTWAYKFGVLNALVEARRSSWRHRDVGLSELDENAQERLSQVHSPDEHVEGADFAGAVRVAIDSALTEHQRRVVLALTMGGVPPDVLAERLGSTRNAMYKTLHDARVRLRAHLTKQGYFPENTREELEP